MGLYRPTVNLQIGRRGEVIELIDSPETMLFVRSGLLQPVDQEDEGDADVLLWPSPDHVES